MDKLTQKEVDECITELKAALEENIAASQMETEMKLRKERAHFRLLRAKEALRALEVN